MPRKSRIERIPTFEKKRYFHGNRFTGSLAEAAQSPPDDEFFDTAEAAQSPPDDEFFDTAEAAQSPPDDEFFDTGSGDHASGFSLGKGRGLSAWTARADIAEKPL